MTLVFRFARPTVQAVGTIPLLVLLGASTSLAQVPTPESVLGFEPGADYKLADWDQVRGYYEKLDAASDRVRMTTIGTTSMGRSMKLLFLSSAENLDNLDRWREISSTLARARVAEEKAQRLARRGRPSCGSTRACTPRSVPPARP